MSKLIIDHADIETIRRLYEYFPVKGITTNPTILCQSGRPPYEVLREIRNFIGKEADLHVQVINRTAENMIHEALDIKNELGNNTYVKIPVTLEGLKAIKHLSQTIGNITATAVYSKAQAYLASEAGADYIAPYVNRIDNLAQNGVQTVKSIQDIFTINHKETKILAASFKNVQQVIELIEYGVDSITVAPDIIDTFMKNEIVDMAIETFSQDFSECYGKNASMKIS